MKNTAKKVIPEKVSKTIEKSVQTGIDFLSTIWEKRKLLTDEAKKKVRKNLLDFNKKIANLWKKPEFEIKEIKFLAGKKITIKGKEGFFPNEFFQKNEKTIETKFRKNPGTKARLVLFCEMISIDLKSGEETRKEAAFYSKFHEIFAGNDFSEIINEMKGRILETMDNYTAGKSNWRFEKIKKIRNFN